MTDAPYSGDNCSGHTSSPTARPNNAKGISTRSRNPDRIKNRAVLIPIFAYPEQPGLVFTERRSDLRTR